MVDRGTVRIQIACVSGCLCSMSLPASVDVLNSTDPVKKKSLILHKNHLPSNPTLISFTEKPSLKSLPTLNVTSKSPGQLLKRE